MTAAAKVTLNLRKNNRMGRKSNVSGADGARVKERVREHSRPGWAALCTGETPVFRIKNGIELKGVACRLLSRQWHAQ